MARDEEHFLSRWSRLKRERVHVREPDDPAKSAVPANTPSAEEAELALPPVETLTVESDFTVFMNAKVADGLRRAALKKLFLHPEINIPDPFEPFCNDLTGGEPIPDEMLKSLMQARDALLRPPEPLAEQADRQELVTRVHDPDPEAQTAQAAQAQVAQMPEQADDTGRQDA